MSHHRSHRGWPSWLARCDNSCTEMTTGRGRRVDVLRQPPEREDNHWLDCLVGSAVAASMQGSSLPGTAAIQTGRKRRRITAADVYRR